MSTNNLEEINEKLDTIIKYHKSARFWGTVKGVLWILIMTGLIVLPMIFLRDFINNPTKFIDISQFTEIQKQIQELLNGAK